MLKNWFKSKKQVNNESEHDDWIKRDWILVSNETTPNDLKEFQKLIVLRKPEGEKRVIYDYSLAYKDIDKFHSEAMFNKSDVLSENPKRIIPTYINTKLIDSDLDNTFEWVIKKDAHDITETKNEIRNSESELNEAIIKTPLVDIPILRMSETISPIMLARWQADNYNRSKEGKTLGFEVDDIDGVDILTEKDIEIRDTWADVLKYFESKEAIEKREALTDLDTTLSPFYIPKEQPLFRNFVDDSLNLEAKPEEEKAEFFGEEGVLINQGLDEIHEDPVIEMGDLITPDDRTMIDHGKQTLSFFKNTVADKDSSSYSQQTHDPKYIKFYQESRNITYKKFILNKRRGIYNIRRMPINNPDK